MSIKLLNAFMILTLLNINSCGGTLYGNGGSESSPEKVKITTYKENLNDILCPICEGDDRHLYKFANQTSLVLYCDECSSFWLKPNNLGCDGACREEVVEKTFNSSIDDLFNEEGLNPARWAKKEEIENSEWKYVKFSM